MKFVFFGFGVRNRKKCKLHIGQRMEKVDSVMKELIMPHPHNFWARTAPGCALSIPISSASSAEDHGQELYPFELANVAYCYSVNPKTICCHFQFHKLFPLSDTLVDEVYGIRHTCNILGLWEGFDTVPHR